MGAETFFVLDDATDLFNMVAIRIASFVFRFLLESVMKEKRVLQEIHGRRCGKIDQT